MAKIPFLTVSILENKSLEDIKDKMMERKPFIFRGFDIGPCVKTWTPEYISEKMGETPVKIHVSAHKKLDFINKNFLYKTLPFNELMRRISRNENDNFFIQANELYYLRSLGLDRRGKDVANFMQDYPQLAQDFKYPKVFNDMDFFSAVLRISSAGTQLWTHYDIMDNILVQIRGEKKIVLWPPSEADKLYLVGDKSEVLDVEQCNSTKYPKFMEAVRYQCMLEEGDIIFIPALWFHNITATDMSFGVNIFWKNLPHELYEKKDAYGNKDLVVASKAFAFVENALKSLEVLPSEYEEFYIKRMIHQLQEKLKSLNPS